MDFNSLRTKNGSAAETLLIVDDDVINRGILENIFLPFYTIEEAENGRVGLEKILAEPDRLCAILLDVVMPEMDGIQALKKIKEADANAAVIMCSAMGQQAMVIEAIQSGAKDFIVKPFQAERVLEAVKKVVG